MGDSNGHLEEQEKCKITRTMKGRQHINNCNKGYRMGQGLWQAHHILPISSLNSADHISANKDNLEYLEKCICITDWDINAEPNMMGLDTKIPYRFEKIYPLPRNLPSHLIGHTDYTAESYEYLEANVWDTLKDSREIHNLDPESIEEELKAASKYFDGELHDRGEREGGTLWCWDHRFDKDMENKWYYPFSMSASPRKRHPGIKFVSISLNKLFSIIK